MNSTMILTILIALAAIAYLIYKQVIQQQVSQRDFLLPVIAVIYAGVTFANTLDWNMLLAILIGGGLGVLTGLASGQVVRVWRDRNTGIVYQRGGWSYILILLGLLVARIAIYIVLNRLGFAMGTGFGPINYAFIALALGNFLGRTINVHLRAFSLTNKPVQMYR